MLLQELNIQHKALNSMKSAPIRIEIASNEKISLFASTLALPSSPFYNNTNS